MQSLRLKSFAAIFSLLGTILSENQQGQVVTSKGNAPDQLTMNLAKDNAEADEVHLFKRYVDNFGQFLKYKFLIPGNAGLVDKSKHATMKRWKTKPLAVNTNF